jgi:hypothetical protein
MRKHSHSMLKRLVMVFSGLIALFMLSGCTKSFCTNQDKANQIFAYYGDLYNDSTSVTDVDTSTDNQTLQEKNRKTSIRP